MYKAVFAAFLLLQVQPVLSQVGRLDPTYGTAGISARAPKEMRTFKMVVQPDGKIVAGGFIPDEQEYLITAVARYTATGSMDRSFSNDGLVLDKELNAAIFGSDIAVQKDGKVLVAAVGNACCEGTDLVVKRFNKNGTQDSTFNVRWAFDFDAGSEPELAVQSNGRIVVAMTNQGPMQVLEYNPDGSLYRHFQITNASAEASYTYVSAYPDGGYVLSYLTASGKTVVYSSRFGKRILSLENDFSYGNVQHTIFKNGKVAVVGNATVAGKSVGKLVMLNANGTLDSSFDGDGYLNLTGFETRYIVNEPNGKMIIQGFRTGSSYGIMRLNASGTIDKSFGNSGFVLSDFTGPMAVYGNRLYATGDGRIAAYLLSTNPRYVKVNLYGNSDPYSNRQWNNWNNLRNLHFNNFYYSDSTFSTISAVMSNRNGVNDNGATYGSGIAPAGVLRHSSYSIGARTITFTGLIPTKQYNLELYGSRNANPYDSTIFTINGVSKKICTYRNFTKKATLTGLAPNAQGQIVLTISSTRTYNYLNGFLLTENFPAATASVVTSIAPAIQPKEPTPETSTLQLIAFPNPTRQAFTVQVKSSSNKPVQLRVFDASGRLVEAKQSVAPNTTLTLGQPYKPGIYYLETHQEGQRQLVKLIKAAE